MNEMHWLGFVIWFLLVMLYWGLFKGGGTGDCG